MPGIPTRERILDAAEELFADRGFAATSLRSITARAGVNLAAVNYHFGSKEALVEAVFGRRLGPLNERRLELLDRCERADIEAIVEAFVGPALRLSRELGPRGAVFMRLLGHAVNQPDERIRGLFAEQFREVFARFTAALAVALPGLSREEVVWRFVFTVGAMAHPMALSEHLKKVSGGLCDVSDAEAVIRRLVPFVAAGMRASALAGEDAW